MINWEVETNPSEEFEENLPVSGKMIEHRRAGKGIVEQQCGDGEHYFVRHSDGALAIYNTNEINLTKDYNMDAKIEESEFNDGNKLEIVETEANKTVQVTEDEYSELMKIRLKKKCPNIEDVAVNYSVGQMKELVLDYDDVYEALAKAFIEGAVFLNGNN